MKSKLLKSRYSKLAIVVLLLTALSGCTSVVSKHPVGEKPARIVAKEWAGNWVTTDGAVEIKVIDAERGLLKIFWLEDDKQGNPAMNTAEVELREAGDWLFANTHEQDKNRGFMWARIKNEDRQIVIWPPNDKLFAQAVKDGVFPGELDGEAVILDEFKPQHLKIITSGEKGVFFSWDEPIVYVKVGN